MTTYVTLELHNETMIMADTYAGMVELAGRGISVVLGFISPIVWVPATLIGWPSDPLHTTYSTGDEIIVIISTVSKFTHYELYSTTLGFKRSFYKTTRNSHEIRQIINTMDDNYDPIDYPADVDSGVTYTRNYNNISYIRDIVYHQADVGANYELSDEF